MIIAAVVSAAAQNSPAPQPAAPRSVRISFVPPPLDGSISLGIYDGKGALVRVLHREEDIDDFEAGNDSLVTTWDGTNDAGQPLPPGKYRARGFVVGELKVEGVGFFFNDWVRDEKSFRIVTVTAVAIENGLALLSVKLADGRALSLLLDQHHEVATTAPELTRRDSCDDKSALSAATDPISCAPGKDKTRWVIDRGASDSVTHEVQQFSASGELLRHLSVPPNEPQPVQIAASLDGDAIFLLEEGGGVQRVRFLTLLATKSGEGQAVSDWKVDFERRIVAHKEFTVEQGRPVPAGGTAPPDKVAIKLQPNPLEKDQRKTAEVAVGYDEEGSFLTTADGLPLQTISATPHLTRIVLSPHGENSIDVFQDDDAVVEQFRLQKLDDMMAFDCGDFELK